MFLFNNKQAGRFHVSFVSLHQRTCCFVIVLTVIVLVPTATHSQMQTNYDWTNQLHNNRLKGSLPSEIGNCFWLKNLEVQDNWLTGQVPSSMVGGLEKLSSQNLETNNFTGSVPDEICSLKESFDSTFVAVACKNVTMAGAIRANAVIHATHRHVCRWHARQSVRVQHRDY